MTLLDRLWRLADDVADSASEADLLFGECGLFLIGLSLREKIVWTEAGSFIQGLPKKNLLMGRPSVGARRFGRRPAPRRWRVHSEGRPYNLHSQRYLFDHNA